MGFFDVSLDTANQFYAWGWRASVAGALLTTFGVGFLFWGTRIRDRDFETQMTSLNVEAGNARERAGKLEEQAGTLKKEAEDARLEQERLKARLAWRVLTPEIQTKLKTAFSVRPSKINIEYVANDTESQYFAIQLANLLTDANWQVGFLQVTYAGQIFFGLWIPESKYEGTTFLREALTAAQISFAAGELPSNSMGYGARVQDAGTLLVGSKPLPK